MKNNLANIIKDNREIETEINTRLWYALGDVEPTDERLLRAVASIKDLFLTHQLSVIDGVMEWAKNITNEQLTLFNGKLPFVVFNGKADENEKITIYNQALSDILSYLQQAKEELTK